MPDNTQERNVDNCRVSYLCLNFGFSGRQPRLYDDRYGAGRATLPARRWLNNVSSGGTGGGQTPLVTRWKAREGFPIPIPAHTEYGLAVVKFRLPKRTGINSS